MSLDADIARTKTILQGVNIPPQNEVVRKIREEQKLEEPNMQRIAEFISDDVRTSAEVIKMVNSPFFGLRRRVESIQQAVMQLGLRNINSVVMNLFLKSMLGSRPSQDLLDLWDYTNRLAMISNRLSRRVKKCAPEEAYMAALFTNCGQLLLTQVFQNYGQVYQEAVKDRKNITETELAEFNTTHMLVGYVVAEFWELEDELRNVILNHHMFDAEYFASGDETKEKILAAMVKASEYVFCQIAGRPQYVEWDEIGKDVCATLGTDVGTISGYVHAIQEEIEAEASV